MKLFKMLASFLLSICLLSFAVSGETYPEYLIEIPDGFVSAAKNTDKSEVAKLTGMTPDAVEDYFTANNLLLFAADSDNSTQIMLSSYIDNFSEKTLNFAYLENNKLLELADGLFSKTGEQSKSKVTVIENNGHKFLKRSEAHKDSGGKYVVTVYMTVVNGENYSLSVMCEGDRETDIADSLLKTLQIHINDKSEEIPFYLKIFIFGGIIICSVVVVISSIGLIKKEKESLE